MRDYVAWHDEYGEPGSRLHQRLQVVIELIGQALDGSPPGPIRFVSLCAGQGHDILSVAATHPRGRDLTGRLVELDPVNATAAAARIEELGLTGIEVRTADAGTTDAYEGAVPADLVVACGIFGNVSLDDIERTDPRPPIAVRPGCVGGVDPASARARSAPGHRRVVRGVGLRAPGPGGRRRRVVRRRSPPPGRRARAVHAWAAALHVRPLTPAATRCRGVGERVRWFGSGGVGLARRWRRRRRRP